MTWINVLLVNFVRAVRVYPKGNVKADGRDVSVFLYCAGSDTPTPSERVQANYSICIKNQLHDHKHKLRCKLQH